jgi:hypothetical protein
VPAWPTRGPGVTRARPRVGHRARGTRGGVMAGGGSSGEVQKFRRPLHGDGGEGPPGKEKGAGPYRGGGASWMHDGGGAAPFVPCNLHSGGRRVVHAVLRTVG